MPVTTTIQTPPDWGKRVAKQREKLKMTQRRLADACGVTSQSISRIERGLESPRFGLMKRLAKELHQELEDLFPYPPIDWNG